MFDHITTYHYGRCVKDSNWYLKSIGINRLYYIHSGSVSVLLDRTRLELQAGRIYLFPQNLKFELILTDKTQVDHTFFDFFTLPAIKMDAPIETDPGAFPLIAGASDILFRLAEKYPTYPSMGRNEMTPLVESYLENMLFLLNRSFPIQLVEDPRINRMLDYIHRNYNREITLEDLTGITNLEKNYLIRLFKSSMNVTPYQYIKKYRFNIALTMLKRKHSLKEAARAIGYSDEVSFSHAFKKIYGMPPSQIMERAESREE